MSYFSEVAMGLSEERSRKHTPYAGGPFYGSQGYIVTYELISNEGIEDVEILVKGDLFDASRQARQFVNNPNIDNIYVWDKKSGVVVETVLERV